MSVTDSPLPQEGVWWWWGVEFRQTLAVQGLSLDTQIGSGLGGGCRGGQLRQKVQPTAHGPSQCLRGDAGSLVA